MLALALVPSLLLRFRPPVGTTARYVMTMTMRQSGPSTPAPLVVVQTVPFALRALGRRGTDTRLETRTGKARVRLPAAMAAGRAKLERALSGLAATATVDELAAYRTPPGNAHAALARGMGTSVLAGAQGLVFPGSPLRPGDSWGTTLDLSKALNGVMGGAMRAKGTIPVSYRLAGLDARGAHVAVLMAGGTALDLGPMRMRLRLTSTGTVLVDPATGLVREASTRAVTDISGGPGQAMRQSVDVSLRRL